MKILDEHISDEQYGIGFLLGNEELRDEVEAILLEMVKDGTFEEISKKYFDTNVASEELLKKAEE
jgi:polar amino acid transport system substrate-binding protein